MILMRPDVPRSVMVVDDDYALRTVMREVFEEGGYLVRTCEDGAAALRALDPPVDVIILDLNMPVMGGRAFMAALRASGERMPRILVLSAHGAAAAAADFGVDSLSKPFDIDSLFAAVEKIAQRPRP